MFLHVAKLTFQLTQPLKFCAFAISLSRMILVGTRPNGDMMVMTRFNNLINASGTHHARNCLNMIKACMRGKAAKGPLIGRNQIMLLTQQVTKFLMIL